MLGGGYINSNINNNKIYYLNYRFHKSYVYFIIKPIWTERGMSFRVKLGGEESQVWLGKQEEKSDNS